MNHCINNSEPSHISRC